MFGTRGSKSASVALFLLWSSVCGAQGSPPTAPPAAPRVASPSDENCKRSWQQAAELSNEGDRLIKIDVNAAIAKYTRATEILPTEHRTYWKLAAAYERREDWPHMAEALLRATALAPSFANYWYRLGFARVNQAHDARDRSGHEHAKAPLERCIALDPNIAECHYLLAEASVWTDDDRTALREYSQAIVKDAKRGFFYPPLAELYLTLGLPEQAEVVLTEGTRKLESNERNRTSLRTIYMLLAVIAQQRRDVRAQIAALEQAEQYVDENHPEFTFMLGATYALMPDRLPAARRLLNNFSKIACRGASAAKFKEQCAEAQALLQRLEAP